MDEDSFFKSIRTNDFVTDLKNLQKNFLFDSSILDKYPELFDETNNMISGKCEKETSKTFNSAEFIA